LIKVLRYVGDVPPGSICGWHLHHLATSRVAVLSHLQEGHCPIRVQAFKAVLDSLHAFPHVHLIVATRLEAPAVAGVGWGAAAVELRALDAEAGMQLLESRLGPAHHWAEADKEAARKLVEEVQGNPLVLSVAVGLVPHGKDFTWQVRRTSFLSFVVRVGVTGMWCFSGAPPA
jgi:hypothetical protein